MTRTRKRAKPNQENGQTVSFPHLEQLRMVILPPELAKVAPSLRLIFELKSYDGECFLLCNDSYVGAVFGLDEPESRDFSKAQLSYIESHLEEDLVLAALSTVHFSFPHAAAVTSRTPVQAKSWRMVEKLEIENLHRIVQKGVKKRGVKVGPPPGIVRRTAEQVRRINDVHRRRIEKAVVKLYGRSNNLEPYRKSALAKEIGISPKTLTLWCKTGKWDFEELVGCALKEKR